MLLNQKNLFAWQHIEINVVLLFGKVLGFARTKVTFCNKQRWHIFESQLFHYAF